MAISSALRDDAQPIIRADLAHKAARGRSIQTLGFIPMRRAKEGWLRLWVVVTGLWLAVIGLRVAYEWENTNERYLVEVTRQAPRLPDWYIARAEARLRSELMPDVSTPKETSSDGPYDQILDDEIKRLEAELDRALGSFTRRQRDTRSDEDVERISKVTGLAKHVVSENLQKADRLARIVELRSSMDASPILRLQVTEPDPPVRRLNIGALVVATIVPPVLLLVLGYLALWIRDGFRNET